MKNLKIHCLALFSISIAFIYSGIAVANDDPNCQSYIETTCSSQAAGLPPGMTMEYESWSCTDPRYSSNSCYHLGCYYMTPDYGGGFHKSLVAADNCTRPSVDNDPHQFTVRKDRTQNFCGSIVKNESRVLGEVVQLVGAPFFLAYSSDRVAGRTGDYTYVLSWGGNPQRCSNGHYRATLEVAGKSYQIDSYPGNTFEQIVVWDGLDSNSDLVRGAAPISVVMEELNCPVGIDPTVQRFNNHFLGTYQAKFAGLGGWTLSAHHFYDKAQKRIYLGSGETEIADYKELATGDLLVIGEDGSEVYTFSSTGLHLNTKNGLTGGTIYSFSYDSQERLVSVTDAYQNQTTVLRDANGNLTGISGPYGQVTSLTVGPDGYLSEIVNPNSESHEMTYYTDGLLHTFEQPRGQISTFTYDTSGQLVSDSSSSGSSWSLSESVDSAYRSITTTSAEGRSSLAKVFYWWDDMNFYTDAAGITTTVTDKPGVSYAIQTMSGSSSTNYSDDIRFGSLLKVPTYIYEYTGGLSRATSISQSVTYNSPSNPDPFDLATLTRQVSRNSKTWSSAYNGSTKTTLSTSPSGRTVSYTIDSYGKPVALQVGNLTPSTLSYDTHGRLESVTQGDRISTVEYNVLGQIKSVTNPLSQKTEFQYTNSGLMTKRILPDLREIGFGYDSNGNLTSITPPGKPAHSFLMNLFDKIMSFVPSSLGGTISTTTELTYNDDKQLTLLERPDGSSATFNYDAIKGRLNTIVIPSGQYSFVYNNTSGKMETITSPDSVQIQRSYSGDLMTYSVVNIAGTSVWIYYNWDNDFNLSSFNFNGVGSTQYIYYYYDNDGLLTSAGSASLGRSVNDGQVETATVSTVADHYTYDSSFGELSGHIADYTPANAPSLSLFEESITRDKLGRIVSKQETVGGTSATYEYEYDSTGRLSNVKRDNLQVSHYDYDSNSNRTGGTIRGQGVTASYDVQDRLQTYNDLVFTYNLNGDLTSKTNSITNDTTSYTYDVFGNLKSVTLPNATLITYLVDGMNRRVQKRTAGVVSRSYIYQSAYQIAAELDSNGQIISQFVYASKDNVPEYMIRNGVTYKIVTDHLGSPRLIVNTTDGSVAQQIEYDEFGRIIADTNPGFQPFGFAGGLYDQDTKLVRFGARDYDPETGRWTSKDPILFAGGDTNLYGYVLNDPINFIDPTGLWGFGIIGGGSVEAGVGIIGAGATGSVGGGVFGGGSQGVNVGGFASGGAFAGGPGYGASAPTCQDTNNGVVGAFAGVGAGGFATNATSPGDLAGYTPTYSFNVGVGPVKFSGQYGRSSNGTWLGSITIGPGIGLSGSRYPTWTK